MSATTALGAAPPEAAGEELAAGAAITEEQEEQKVAKGAKQNSGADVAAESVADDTADISEEETVIAEEVPPSGKDLRPQVKAASDDAARREAAVRVRQAAALPPGLRERLATLVEAGGQIGSDGQALVSVEQAIQAVAEALPDSLRRAGGEVARPEHPGGEAFFNGRTAEEITDQQAEEIARTQLVRSGFIRGQRVRVAQD